VRVALVVTGGVDRSGRDRVVPAILWLIERLARRHTVFVYALRYLPRPDTYPLLGATVRDLGSPAGVFRMHRALVAGLRRDGPFDVLHAYWAMPAGLVGATAARRIGVPCVVTLDSGELVSIPVDNGRYGLQSTWKSRLAVRAVLRLASRTTVCSSYMQALARRHGVDPEVIALGVDRRLFFAAPTPPGPPWRLLHVASLNPVKDQTTLVEALRHVVDRGLDVHLDIVGEDTLGGRIQRLVQAIGLQRRVTFHGVKPTPEVAAFFQRAHLHVLSSRHEAAGVVVLEAAASRVATVGSAVGYIADWGPEDAVPVAPADPRALADAIAELLADPARRAAIADRAHTRAAAHDADWTAATFERLYEALA
jgi:glycosyltransferase involved in cell wall biosynthesis